MVRGLRILAAVTLLAVGGGVAADPASAAGTEIVTACGSSSDGVFQSLGVFGINAVEDCPVAANQPYGLQVGSSVNTVADGERAFWYTTAPAGMEIIEADANSINAPSINEGNQYGGGFFWGPDGANGAIADAFSTNADYGVAEGTPGFPTQTYGIQVVCGANPCTQKNASIDVNNVTLTAQEAYGPNISAGGLWDAGGWVRGAWPITANGDSPAGVCSLSATFDSQQVAAAAFPANDTVWHQCDAIGLGGLSGTVNTTQFPDGAQTLSVADQDATGYSNGSSETVNVDNQTPRVTLSGPAQALSTAGPQVVTATLGTGPSGAYGITCSVDGGPSQFYDGATASVPVSGVGTHSVSCTGENNALSSTGQRASSAPASFSLDIQQPTAQAITFSHIADQLRCRTVTRRIAVRGRAHRVRRHGRTVVVRARTHHVTRRLRRCHARTVRRRVSVVLMRHGKPVLRHGHVVHVRRTRRVIKLPHRVDLTRRRIRHGRGTTVSGFLGLTDGTPLPGRTVTVLGAADDGHPSFAPVSSAVTNPNGVWVAKIPAGPSRLLEAEYGGDATTAAAGTTTVRLVVPARIKLSISPRILPWRHAITITGRLLGGAIPPDGVALRFLVRYPHSPARSTLLALRTNRRGRFRFTWSYHGGRGVARYPFTVSTTAAETDYPFAAASSRPMKITFGRATPHHHHRRRGHHRQAHRRRNEHRRTHAHRHHRHRHRHRHHRR